MKAIIFLNLVKFTVSGTHTIPARMKVKFSLEQATYGRFFCAKFHLQRCNVSTVRDEEPKQAGQHPLTGQRVANFRLLANQ